MDSDYQRTVSLLANNGSLFNPDLYTGLRCACVKFMIEQVNSLGNYFLFFFFFLILNLNTSSIFNSIKYLFNILYELKLKFYII